MNGTITMLQALQITGICMGIVFATLVVISFIIDLNRMLVDGMERKSKPEPVEAPAAVTPVASSSVNGKRPEELTDDEEIAAAIVASIEASEGNQDAKVKILAVREIG